MQAINNFRRLSPSLILKTITPIVILAILLLGDSALHLSILSLVFFLIALYIYRFEPTNVWVAFATPWLMILFFSILSISEYSREINVNTVRIIVIIISIGLLILPSKGALDSRLSEKYLVDKKLLFYIFLGYLTLAVLNVVFAGYVPLLRLIFTGESGYMEFGLKGLYGFYNAFGNALGLTAFYLWITKGDKFYRVIFFTILLLFLLFMTRQNITSLLVEAFVVYSFSVRKFSSFRLFTVIAIFLLIFGVIGDFRLGKDIGELARIKDEYSWIPSAVIWLYSYSFFNILNLDNAVELFKTPVMDLSSVSGLIPSFFRSELNDPETILEVSSFTVGSFILPIYRDLGFWLLIILFSLLCLLAKYYYNKIRPRSSYEAIANYSIIYFCFLFSFFENFWFYLPIIFQLPFIVFFRSTVVRSVSRKSST